MSITRAVLLASLSALLLRSESLAATPVTACGETVTDGVLTADLDCSAGEDFGLIIADGGTLDLAGYTLTGSADYGVHWSSTHLSGGVHCLGSCTIAGNGGAIVAPAGLPEQTWYSFGVYSDPHARSTTVTVTDTTISGWASAGVQGVSLQISGSTFADNFFGVGGRKKSTIDNCTFTGHTIDAIHTYTAVVSNSTITGNAGAMYALKKLHVINTTVENNDFWGFNGLKLRAEGSTFANNCLADPQEWTCADVMAIFNRRPRLENSTCESSLKDRDDLTTWRICSNDE